MVRLKYFRVKDNRVNRIGLNSFSSTMQEKSKYGGRAYIVACQ